MQWVRLLHQRSSRKKKKKGLLDEKKKKYWQKLDWRSWCRDILFGVATWLRLGQKGPRSRHEIHVVTWEKKKKNFEVAT